MRKEATSYGHMWTEATVWTRMFLASWTPLDMLIGQSCGQYGQNCGQHSLVRCAALQTYQVSMDKSACKYFADKTTQTICSQNHDNILTNSIFVFPCTIIAMRVRVVITRMSTYTCYAMPLCVLPSCLAAAQLAQRGPPSCL